MWTVAEGTDVGGKLREGEGRQKAGWYRLSCSKWGATLSDGKKTVTGTRKPVPGALPAVSPRGLLPLPC